MPLGLSSVRQTQPNCVVDTCDRARLPMMQGGASFTIGVAIFYYDLAYFSPTATCVNVV